jgi:hypothetical protein
MYRARLRGWEAALLVGAALIAIAVVMLISPPVRLLVRLLYERVRQFMFDLRH